MKLRFADCIGGNAALRDNDGVGGQVKMGVYGKHTICAVLSLLVMNVLDENAEAKNRESRSEKLVKRI